jgi:hypothetical protein
MVFRRFLIDLLALETKTRFSDLMSEIKSKGLVATFDEKWSSSANASEEKVGEMDLRPILRMAADIAFENIKLKTPLVEFNRNVRRFQLLVREALGAAESLTSDRRQIWWRENVLPSQGIKYYNIGASMIVSGEEANAYSHYTYNRRSPDYFNLLQGFTDFSEKLGFPMNDSQVSLERALLWPPLNKILNAHQEPIEVHTLAVFQTHHWGIALEQVTNMKDRSLDPFPRETMLSSLVQSIY